MDNRPDTGANRKLILLAVLIAVGAGIVLYHYMQEREGRIARQAREDAMRQMRDQILRAREAGKLSPEKQAEEVALAKGYLDQWNGQDDSLLIQASSFLHDVLKSNPKNVAAHIEMARYYIMSGYVGGRDFQPGTLEKAMEELQTALRTDPRSADAYVLWGYVLYLRGGPRDAVKELAKAEAIGTENPWLYLNWADALIDMGDWSGAESKLRKAEAKFDAAAAKPPAKLLAQMHQKLAVVMVHLGKMDQADKEFLSVIALQPESAWNHGNYADFLLFTRASPDAAMVEAQKALEIMDYGKAKLTLAEARYAKWAGLRNSKPKEAAKYLASAKETSVDYNWIMPQAAKSVSAGPAIDEMVRGLMALGVSIDTRDNKGDSGLTLAADAGNLKSVEILARYGANLNAADNEGRTALISAATKGYVDIVRALAARGARVNAQDFRGGSALGIAVTNHDERMVRTLLSLKANPNLAGAKGITPLMNAALVGDAGLARVLIEGGADPNAVSKINHMTAADFALDRKDEELARYLHEREAKHARSESRP